MGNHIKLDKILSNTGWPVNPFPRWVLLECLALETLVSCLEHLISLSYKLYYVFSYAVTTLYLTIFDFQGMLGNRINIW